MPKVTVDGVELDVPTGATVLQACELAGKEIPRFCYHERLSIAGNCRMCLVEVKPGPPKPQASCALPAADGQDIRTDTPMVRHAREGVMEFLLINHPLDCPICDQGGECDLQDQAMAYGRGGSRYDENKRAVTEKYMGPIIKTIMTRCIHCTRCVRFAEEVAGVEDIGAIGRGESMQITSYMEQAVNSELSGNVVDLCPVGALTSKPYAFEARPWELTKTPGVDVMDAVGTNIRIDARGREVMRVLPRVNDDVNEEWAHDKTRYAIDGLMRRRLDRPYVRRGGTLAAVSWSEALAATGEALRVAGDNVAVIAGDLVDCETMYAARELVRSVGGSVFEGRQTGLDYDVSNLGSVALNPGIAGLERADAVLLVGTNLRWEAPLLNTRIRKAVRRLKDPARVFAVGPEVDLTYPVTWLGEGLDALADLPDEVTELFGRAERPVLLVGPGALAAGGQGAAHKAAETLGVVTEDWNGFGVVHTSASRMGGLVLGYAAGGGMAAVAEASPRVVLLLGADEFDARARFPEATIVYMGHHGDAGAHAADIVLPGAAYTEKDGTYVNVEGRVQRTEKAIFPPGDAREDWAILRALSDVIDRRLPFDSWEACHAAMIAAHPELGREGERIAWDWSPPSLEAKREGAIRYRIADFYLTNPIARASETMQRCSAELIHGAEMLEAAE